MRLDVRGEYPRDWKAIAARVKDEAGWRCVRCRHPFVSGDRVGGGKPLPCDDDCDEARCRHQRIAARDGVLCLTVHHLDGDKANCRWWNLLALCNACHLSVQARVILERPWMLEHSAWFRVYVAGFYAWYYGGLTVTRDQAERHLDRFLALNPVSPDFIGAGAADTPPEAA